jgi:bifunctional DNA-binding transcriptional regulator/antitoxin component of YhaV-PrlF toxin-antitoxin module
MKATEIVRRIDDLGRVVIPKELRRTMRIREATRFVTCCYILNKTKHHKGLMDFCGVFLFRKLSKCLEIRC